MRLHLVALLLVTAVSALPQGPKWRRATEPIPAEKRVSRALSPEEILTPKKPGSHRKPAPAHYRPSLEQDEACSVENPCAVPPDARVVGGEEACPNQFPWLVTVLCDQSTGGGGWLCTGSLIFPDYVLTAGHCAYGCLRYSVYAGAHSLDAVGTPGDETLVIEVDGLDGYSFVHPDYQPFFNTLSNYDVAILPLPEEVPLSDTISLSCLPTRDMEEDDFAGEFATVTGWGKTSDNSGGAADVPNFAHDIPLISNDECRDQLDTVLGVTDQMICIDTSDGRGICSGDSGGPLNLQPAEGEYGPYVQVGVTSWGPNEGCENGKPHVFARVTEFLDWIADTTGYDI